MTTHSRSVLYIVKESDIVIPINLLKEKILFTFLKLSNFDQVKLIFRYTTNSGSQIHLLSLYNLGDFHDNERVITDYVIKRLDFGIIHKVREIHSFSLSYTYRKPQVKP